MATRVSRKSKIGKRIAKAAKTDSLDLGIGPGAAIRGAGRFAKSLAKQVKRASDTKAKANIGFKLPLAKGGAKKAKATGPGGKERRRIRLKSEPDPKRPGSRKFVKDTSKRGTESRRKSDKVQGRGSDKRMTIKPKE